MSYQTILPLAAIEIVGDFALKNYANKGGLLPLSIGVTSYIGVVYFLINALRGSTVLLVNGAWDSISTIIESLAAYFILGERFHNYSQYVGLFITIIGVYLLKLPKSNKMPFMLHHLNINNINNK